jgi:hypothetical protein
LRRLHAKHESARLASVVSPPAATGMTCSIERAQLRRDSTPSGQTRLGRPSPWRCAPGG